MSPARTAAAMNAAQARSGRYREAGDDQEGAGGQESKLEAILPPGGYLWKLRHCESQSVGDDMETFVARPQGCRRRQPHGGEQMGIDVSNPGAK